MTTDELIAKSLDGTLTPGEQSQLQAMIAASPELAEEVRRLRTIEDMLGLPNDEQADSAVPFLRSVEDKIAASLAATGGVASASKMSNMPRALFAPLLVLVGSIGIFFAVRPGSDSPAPQAASIQTSTPPSFDMQMPPAHSQPTTPDARASRPSNAVASRTASGAVTTTPNAERPNSIAAATQPRQNEEASALLNKPTIAPATAALIQKHRSDYEKALRDGNKLQAVMSSFQLGFLYKELDQQEAVSFLQKALNLSRETKMREYEAKSLGYLGLIARKDGKTEAADTYLRNCMSLLEQLNNPKLLKDWQIMIEKSDRP